MYDGPMLAQVARDGLDTAHNLLSTDTLRREELGFLPVSTALEPRGLGNWCSVHTSRVDAPVAFPYELVVELAENHTVTPQCEGPTPSFHHFTGHNPRAVCASLHMLSGFSSADVSRG
jgi:hypothetical protein